MYKQAVGSNLKLHALTFLLLKKNKKRNKIRKTFTVTILEISVNAYNYFEYDIWKPVLITVIKMAVNLRNVETVFIIIFFSPLNSVIFQIKRILKVILSLNNGIFPIQHS